jgi:alpha-tubulin suppressor-like RCC1 family protein
METRRIETFQQKLISLMERKLYKLHVDTIIVWHWKVILIQLNLQENGNVYSWGKNEQGQLGNNTEINELKPILIMNLKGESVYCGYDCSFILQNGELWSCGKNHFGQLGLGDKINRSTFEKVKLDHKVTKFHTSGHHSIMLLGKLR